MRKVANDGLELSMMTEAKYLARSLAAILKPWNGRSCTSSVLVGCRVSAVAVDSHWKVSGLLDELMKEWFGTVFLNQIKNKDLSSYEAFHCWILCEDQIIDFMAPLFPELLKEKGFSGKCSRKMFQKPRTAIANSPLLMKKPRDFYLLPNVDLTKNILQDFFSRPMNEDLVKVCATWYKRPPKDIERELTMQDNDGRAYKMTLSGIALSGAW